MNFGDPELRAFFRTGPQVSFGGVGTYPDGQPVQGLFDAPGQDAVFDRVSVEDTAYTLTLPYNAFNPMPDTKDVITLLSGPFAGQYAVRNPNALSDGSTIAITLRKL